MKPISLAGCTILGGFGHLLEPGTKAFCSWSDQGVEIGPRTGPTFSIAYSEILAIQITGRGAVTGGGGFVGAGFGIKGAAEGMVIASVLNSLSRQTRNETIIAIEAHDATCILHYPGDTPQSLHIRLSEVLAQVEGEGRGRKSETATDVTDQPFVDQLRQLAALHGSGALTTDEFQAAKAKILGTY